MPKNNDGKKAEKRRNESKAEVLNNHLFAGVIHIQRIEHL